MGRLEFTCISAFWLVPAFLVYRLLLFCPVFDLTYNDSARLMAAIVLPGMVLGTAVTFTHRRNYASILCNLALSFGTYFLLSLWFIKRELLFGALAAAAAAAIAYTVWVMRTYIADRRAHRVCVSAKRCLAFSLLSSRALVSVVVAAVMILAMVNPTLGLPAMARYEPYTRTEAAAAPEDEATDCMDTLLLLQEEEWAKLDADTRLDVLKTVADLEADYLGFPKVSVVSTVLSEFSLGYYSHEDRLIMVNLSILSQSDARTVLFSLLHECYHAYQHTLVDLYRRLDADEQQLQVFREAAIYQQEFDNYISGTEDFDAYSNQWCEIDSDFYADMAMDGYYDKIAAYLQEE